MQISRNILRINYRSGKIVSLYKSILMLLLSSNKISTKPIIRASNNKGARARSDNTIRIYQRALLSNP